MRLFYYPFWILWRFWYYFLVASVILLLFPFLFISILFESWYPLFFKIAQIWARLVLMGMGFRTRSYADFKPDPKKSYVFVANHTSMTDIMLMLILVKSPFVFVGKKELASIPIFGFFYRRTCILVDRNDPKSRHAVYESAQHRLNQGLSLCIFPEGGVPDENVLLDTFKDGAFRLAIAHQIPIVPLTFPDNKKLFSYTFFSGRPGLMRAKIHQAISTFGKTPDDKKALREQARQVIFDQLIQFQQSN